MRRAVTVADRLFLFSFIGQLVLPVTLSQLVIATVNGNIPSLFYFHLLLMETCFPLVLLKDGTIKVKDLSLPELIGIMDTCFCCLVRM